MTQNSTLHYRQLRQALQQELHQASVPVSSVPAMKKFIPWLVAMPLTGAALAIALFWQQPQHPATNTHLAALSLSDFISAAQAGADAQPNQVLHQKVRQYYFLNNQPTTTILETWNGDRNYADQQLSEDGTVLEKYLEVYDPTVGQRRGYDLHPIDPITEPIDPATLPTGICFVNANDFPELSFEQQVAKLTQAMSDSASMVERMTLLHTMVEQGKVTDLGSQAGLRGLEIVAHQQTFQYWFDENSYTLKTYRELDANGQLQREHTYLVDEYLETSETTLPIFTDLSGLTEIHLYEDLPGLGSDFMETHSSGCYDNNGEKVSDINYKTTIDADGNVITEFTDISADQ